MGAVKEKKEKLFVTRSLRVMDVVHHSCSDGRPGAVDLYIEYPAGMEFPLGAASGIGIPGDLPDEVFDDLVKNLAPSKHDHSWKLRAHNARPAPNYAAPSDMFLERLEEKINEAPLIDNALTQNIAYLKMALKYSKEELQANYSVFDLVRLFPNVMTAQDILETQPKEHGNKTYTVDESQINNREGMRCFRINVADSSAPVYQALFGEKDPWKVRVGQTSSYLMQLKKGDFVKINDGVIKIGAQLPSALNRPVVLVSQGNAMIKMVSILEGIRARKAGGEVIGPIVLIGAFKKSEDILEHERLKTFIEDGTLYELHYALSKEPTLENESDQAAAGGGIYFHCGQYVQDVLQENVGFFKKPFVYLAGGEGFTNKEKSVGLAMAGIYGYAFPDEDAFKTDSNMRLSKAPDRRPLLQGKPYAALSLMHALRKTELAATAYN